jgi:hypothetical protein
MRTALFIQSLSVHLPSTPGVAQLAVYYAYTLSLDLISRLTPASSTTYHVQNAPYHGAESPPQVRCHECEPTADECERETKNVGVVPQIESMIVGQEGCSRAGRTLFHCVPQHIGGPGRDTDFPRLYEAHRYPGQGLHMPKIQPIVMLA